MLGIKRNVFILNVLLAIGFFKSFNFYVELLIASNNIIIVGT